MIIFIVVKLIMVIFPFPMSVSYITGNHYYISYNTFILHITVEILYWILFLYIISLLKFIGAKKFIQVSFYILLCIRIIAFLCEILNFFWHIPIVYYSYFSIFSLLGTIYFLIATLLIKNSTLAAPYRIYSLSLFFIFILQLVYFQFIFRFTHSFTNIYKSNVYEYGLKLLTFIPVFALLYILIRSEKFDENDIGEVPYTRPIFDEEQ